MQNFPSKSKEKNQNNQSFSIFGRKEPNIKIFHRDQVRYQYSYVEVFWSFDSYFIFKKSNRLRREGEGGSTQNFGNFPITSTYRDVCFWCFGKFELVGINTSFSIDIWKNTNFGFLISADTLRLPKNVCKSAEKVGHLLFDRRDSNFDIGQRRGHRLIDRMHREFVLKNSTVCHYPRSKVDIPDTSDPMHEMSHKPVDISH